MYYPFLRGKQEELLAVKELLLSDKLSERVTPVIELVKLSSTLIKTLETFINAERNIYLVMNPIVGEFEDNMSEILLGNEDPDEEKKISKLNQNRDSFDELFKSEFIKVALYYGNDFNSYFNDVGLESTNEIAVLLKDSEENERFSQSTYARDSRISLCFTSELEDTVNFPGKAVLWKDRFNKKARNSDYDNPEDEFFSKDHLMYSKFDCIGFSDYSIVGSEYIDGGFAPYAIVIHIIYQSTDNNFLRIHHFMSDTNNSSKNPALKYEEATVKLVNWCEPNLNIKTLGYSKIKENYDTKSYPGLGCIKRFSIMHHLETTGKLLDILRN